MLGKRRCLRCGQPLSVNLDHRVSRARGMTELVARADQQLLSLCNIMFPCQHLGMIPEEGRGRIRKIKCLIPHISPPLHFRLALRLQNGGRICGTLRYSLIRNMTSGNRTYKMFPPCSRIMVWTVVIYSIMWGYYMYIQGGSRNIEGGGAASVQAEGSP